MRIYGSIECVVRSSHLDNHNHKPGQLALCTLQDKGVETNW